MQRAVLNRSTLEVANTTEISGRVTADSIKHRLWTKKLSSLLRLSGLTIFGPLTASLTGIDTITVPSRNNTAREAAEAPPQISSTPVTTGQVGTAYRYQVLADDPDGDPLRYWVIGPKDMAISADGLVTWAPIRAGFFRIVVNVTHGQAGKASQAYTVTVTEPAD